VLTILIYLLHWDILFWLRSLCKCGCYGKWIHFYGGYTDKVYLDKFIDLCKWEEMAFAHGIPKYTTVLLRTRACFHRHSSWPPFSPLSSHSAHADIQGGQQPSTLMAHYIHISERGLGKGQTLSFSLLDKLLKHSVCPWSLSPTTCQWCSTRRTRAWWRTSLVIGDFFGLR